MDKDRIHTLLDAHLSGKLDAGMREELASLLESPGGEEQFSAAFDEQMKNRIFETDDELEDVYTRLSRSLSESIRAEKNRIHFLRRWGWAAASILIILAAGVYFWPTSQKPAAVADIAPGTNKAILTLADGSAIPLDSAGSLVIQQGVTTVQQHGGQLQYDVQGSSSAIGFNKLSTPHGGQFQLTLPDGSKVWLNAASSLRYPTVFPGHERIVEVSGEAYFEVVNDASKPFRVKVNGMQEVEVLGTSFNVNAYTDEKAMYTTLLEGRVRVAGVTLLPGQQAQVTATGTKVVVADMAKAMAWKNGFFNFEDQRLEEVMRQLIRWYDIEVVYPHGVPDVQFFGRMSRGQSLANVLRLLEVSDIRFRLEEGRRLIVLQ